MFIEYVNWLGYNESRIDLKIHCKCGQLLFVRSDVNFSLAIEHSSRSMSSGYKPNELLLNISDNYLTSVVVSYSAVKGS